MPLPAETSERTTSEKAGSLDHRGSHIKVPGVSSRLAGSTNVMHVIQISGEEIEASQVVTRGHRSIWGLALAGSLVLHGLVLASVVYRPAIDAIGSGGQDLEAISIDVVAAAALEGQSARVSTATAGATGPLAESRGVNAPSQEESAAVTAAALEAKLESHRPRPPPDIVAESEPLPDPDPSLSMAKAAEPIEHSPEEPPAERPPEKQTEQTREKPETFPMHTAPTSSEAQRAAVTGGATARASAESIETEAAAGASPGELARYALAVRLALGRARPAHAGRKGKVTVQFRLSTSGMIESADVLQSSGSADLDQTALAAVRATSFPVPPEGSSDRQRSYTVPFDFK